MSAAASATSMSCFSPRTSTRKNSRPSSVPTNGVSGGTPAAARCRGVSEPADTVMMPTRWPGGSIACTQGTWISALVATGTRTCAASSAWNSDRKPQLVVIASAPSRHQFGRGRQEIVQQSGRGVQHHAFRRGAAHHAVEHRERPGGRRCPCRPGMRGNVASSIRIPSGAPYSALPPLAMTCMLPACPNRTTGGSNGRAAVHPG